MSQEVLAILERGGIPPAAAAQQLGIGTTTLLRLEGTVFPKCERYGRYKIRVVKPTDLAAVREWMRLRARGRAVSACAAARRRKEEPDRLDS